MRTFGEFRSHSWTPGMEKHLDFGLRFDPEKEAFLVAGITEEVTSEYIGAANTFGQIALGLFLQIESCALKLCVIRKSLEPAESNLIDWDMHILEEARHLGSIQRYIGSRWGHDLPQCNDLDDWINRLAFGYPQLETLRSAQTFLESAAQGLAILLHSHGCDPLLVRMSSFILADEDFHLARSEPVSLPQDRIHYVLKGYVCDKIKERISSRFCEKFISLFESYNLLWMPLSAGLKVANLESPEAIHEAKSLLASKIETISKSAQNFLDNLQKEDHPVPPASLAVEWLVAGLRGRGQQPVSRKRKVPLKTEIAI